MSWQWAFILVNSMWAFVAFCGVVIWSGKGKP